MPVSTKMPAPIIAPTPIITMSNSRISRLRRTSKVEVAIHRDIAVSIPVHVVRPGDQAEDEQALAGGGSAVEATVPPAGPSGPDLAAD